VKLVKIDPPDRFESGFLAAVSTACRKLPMEPNREVFSAEQGILETEQGGRAIEQRIAQGSHCGRAHHLPLQRGPASKTCDGWTCRLVEYTVAQPFSDPSGVGVISAEPCPRELGREIPARRRRVVLVACVLASSMAFIDSSVLTVALPSLRDAFGSDLGTVQWVMNGYLLALAALTLIGGALADALGKARILAFGCLMFGVASAACAVAPSVDWLIGARIIQGIAAALLTPASLALIGATYPKDERAGAIGVWAAASALTSAAGPVVGGWLTGRFGWPAVFWINPPLAIVAVALLWAAAPADPTEPRGFDFVGATLIALSLGALTLGLSQIGNSERPAGAFSLDTGALLAGVLGLAGLGGYVAWERVATHPMTPPRLAQNRAFVGLNAATLLIYAGLAIMFFLLPFELEDRRGLSPASVGLAFLPFSLAVGLLSQLFGGLADNFGARPLLVAGAASASVAYIWMALGQGAALIPGVIAPQALLGISFAVMVAPLTASVLSSVTSSDEGLASGINNAVSRVAQLAGVAIAAGLGTLSSGWHWGLFTAAALSAAGALMTAVEVPPAP
jgi:EmrB/QacA subfamily drug resistance transporter